MYIIAGDYRDARQDIEAMHDAQSPSADVLPSFGWLDTPLGNEAVSSVVPVSGWVLDDVAVARVEVLVDGSPAGTASYGLSRPDVATTYPYVPERIGFTYSLDTRRYEDGPHKLLIRATDTAGHVAVLRAVSIVFQNSARRESFTSTPRSEQLPAARPPRQSGFEPRTSRSLDTQQSW